MNIRAGDSEGNPTHQTKNVVIYVRESDDEAGVGMYCKYEGKEFLIAEVDTAGTAVRNVTPADCPVKWIGY